jgi:N-acetylmuramoyl-L-alanine amidase
VAGKVYEDERHAYYQEKWGWVRIKDGWISLAYTDQKDDDDKQEDDKKDEIVSDGKTTVLGYGVVTTGGLNVRTGPGTENKSIDEMELGDRVAYYQKDGKWIRTKDGWISTTYVYLEGEKGEGAGSGTVTGDKVNLRKGPGTGFDSNGKLNEGDKVEILRTLKIGKHTWGYTSNGWIRMDYVKMS